MKRIFVLLIAVVGCFAEGSEHGDVSSTKVRRRDRKSWGALDVYCSSTVGNHLHYDTISSFVYESSLFETLLAAIQKASKSVSAKLGPLYTLFAPIDFAFNRLPDGFVDRLMSPGFQNHLDDVILMHNLISRNANQVACKPEIAEKPFLIMANGANVSVIREDTPLAYNLFLKPKAPEAPRAQIIRSVSATDGVMHVLNEVLIPEWAYMNLNDTLAARGYSELAKRLVDTGLDALVSENNNTFTLLAPTDEAWASQSEEWKSCLQEDQELLSKVLRYHALSASVSLESGTYPTALEGAEVIISVDGHNVFVNSAALVVDRNILASNGNIQGINKVLYPPNVTCP